MAALLLLAAHACRDAPALDAAAPSGVGGASLAPFDGTLSGRLVDEAGQGLPGATVTLDGNHVIACDETGAFAEQVAERGRLVLAFAAEGHMTKFRPVRTDTIDGRLALGDVPLRPSTPVQRVTLPVAGQAPVQVVAAKGNASVTLELKEGQLVGPDGRTARGEVEVALNFWHPQEDLRSAPAMLMTQQPDGTPLPLACFGMMGIDIEQNGTALKVAPGQDLTAHVLQPPDLAPRWGDSSVELYWLDPALGIWRQQGDRNDGRIRYDKTTRIATLSLPHLSYWNVDGSMYPSNGGCVTGRALNACDPNQVLPNQPVTVWFLSAEEVKRFPTQADGSGRFWAATPISNFQLNANFANNETQVIAHYLLTGQDIGDTMMCNPLPSGCRTCDPFYEGWQEGTNFCNKCVLDIPGHTPYQEVPVQQSYKDTCTPPLNHTNLVACQFPPDAAVAPNGCTAAHTDGRAKKGVCSELVPFYRKGPGCNCAASGQRCDPSARNSCCPDPAGLTVACNPATRTCNPPCPNGRKNEGDRCSARDACCVPATLPEDQQLVCADNICLKKNDPQVSGL